MPGEYIEEVYWANFYAYHAILAGSTFFDTLNARADLPPTVLDIGCGDGRDSLAFARGGRVVVGVDRSQAAIRHAQAKAEESGLAGSLTFLALDMSHDAAVHTALQIARELAGEAPLLFYLRFFLHSVPEDVQHCRLTASRTPTSTASSLRPSGGSCFRPNPAPTRPETPPRRHAALSTRCSDRAR